MKKVFLSLVAVLLCGVTFAQTTDTEGRIIINSREEFLKIGTTGYPLNGNYIQTVNIDLGDKGEIDEAIIPSFSGDYDGNNYTISYQANFLGNTYNGNYGLFGSVNGKIKDLKVNAGVTFSGTQDNMQVGLLCGLVNNNGTIELCNVSGNINSTVQAGNGGGTDAGLVAGQCLGSILYCAATGNVTGVGYVGGIVGQLGSITNYNGVVKGCSFIGNVTALQPSDVNCDTGEGSFAGGICGFEQGVWYVLGSARTSISLCYANANISSVEQTSGIASASCGFGTGGNCTYTYCTGTVNNNPIDTDDEVTNTEGGTTTGNYHAGSTQYLNTIVTNLNNQRTEEEEDIFYFAVVNGEIVLVIGQHFVCEAPINLTVTAGENGAFNASWGVANQDNTVNETNFRCSLTNNGQTIQQGTTTATTLSGTLEASAYPYILTIESDCSASQGGLYSDAISYTFYVDANCTPVSGLQLSNIGQTSATASWTGTANSARILLGETEIYSIDNPSNPLSLSNLQPGTTYTLEVIVNCTKHEGNTEINYTIPTSVTFTTTGTVFSTRQSGNFYDPNTWSDGIVPVGTANITINQGHEVTVYHNLVITENYKIITNKGVLRINQDGQLINQTNVNVPGIVEIVSPENTINKWTFVGAPFAGYKLNAVMPVSGSDVAMVKYDYTNGAWSDDWAYVGDTMEAAEGTFAWPFYGGVISFTTYGDLCTWNPTANDGQGAWVAGSYDFTKTPDYALNNGNVTVTKPIVNSSNGNWMALANPYPAKLSVSEFLNDNELAELTVGNIQGEGVYLFNGTSFDYKNSGDILMTEGFFVNFAGGAGTKSVTFKKNQLSYNQGAKSSANELIELTLQNGDDKVRVYFAHNEDAEQGYDIFDANKMFATTGVAEPYFVTDGIALIKEEVAELPYYATMNVRSQQDTVMNFVLTNLPEGYAVSIIDGEEVIDLVEGGVYSTEILTGENADRFKVLVKKNVGLADVEELDVTIINSNRHISITAQEDVKVTVYNTLGQRVFETEKTDFVLSGVASGAYVVKVQGAKAAKSQKIIVE